MLATRTVAEWLRAAQDASPDAFALYRIIRDEAGGFQDLEFLYTSPAATRMAGVAAAEELLGKRLLALFPASHGNALWESCRRVVDTGEPLCQEVPYNDGPSAGWLEV